MHQVRTIAVSFISIILMYREHVPLVGVAVRYRIAWIIKKMMHTKDNNFVLISMIVLYCTVIYCTVHTIQYSVIEIKEKMLFHVKG